MDNILTFIVCVAPFILSLGVGAVIVGIWELADEKKDAARRKAERHRYDAEKISYRKAIANLYYDNLIKSTRKGEKKRQKNSRSESTRND